MKLIKKIEQEVEVEVTFPLYVTSGDQFDGGGFYECWTRIDAAGRMVELTRRSSYREHAEWEIEDRLIDLRTALGAYLEGDSHTKVGEREWVAAVVEMRRFIDECAA